MKIVFIEMSGKFRSQIETQDTVDTAKESARALAKDAQLSIRASSFESKDVLRCVVRAESSVPKIGKPVRHEGPVGRGREIVRR